MTWKWLDRLIGAGEADAVRPPWTVPDGALPQARILAALEANPSAIDPETAKILRFSAGLRG